MPSDSGHVSGHSCLTLESWQGGTVQDPWGLSQYPLPHVMAPGRGFSKDPQLSLSHIHSPPSTASPTPNTWPPVPSRVPCMVSRNWPLAAPSAPAPRPTKPPLSCPQIIAIGLGVCLSAQSLAAVPRVTLLKHEGGPITVLLKRSRGRPVRVRVKDEDRTMSLPPSPCVVLPTGRAIPRLTVSPLGASVSSSAKWV